MTIFRKCTCNRFTPNGPYLPGDCRACWVASGMFDGQETKQFASEIAVGKPIRSPACIHLEATTVHDRRDKSCVHSWIVGCDVHGACTTGEEVTGVKCCRTCNEYVNPNQDDSPVMFDRVVIINLKRRKDRLDAFRARQLSHGWEMPEPQVFEAIEGNKVGVPSYYTSGGGAWGCCRSHVAVLERAVMDGVNSILVLEDDVTWMSDSWERLNQFMQDVPKDWDQLMLGGQHQRHPQSVSDHVVKCFDCQRTHAYAIRGDAIRELLKVWYACNTHIDHRMGPWQAGMNVYAPDKFIFGQSGGLSDISGQRNPDKFWVPPSVSQPVIHLTASKEVVDGLRLRGFHIGFDLTANGQDVGLSNAAKAVGPVRSALIRKWLDAVLWETASMENSVATCWHPDLSVDDLKAIHSGRIVEIKGETVEECLAQAPAEVSLQSNYADTHVVHLTAERKVAEAIQRLGFHIGNWRCPDSGHDHGLRKIAPLPHKVIPLTPWIDVVSKEAAMIPNGVATVWHPSIQPSDVIAASGGRKVVVVKGDSVKEIVRQFREAIL